MPNAFQEPLPLRWLRAHGVHSLTPWYFIEREETRSALRDEYCTEVYKGSQPVRDIYPFARRQDNDDVAGFVVRPEGFTGEVVIAHLTWSGQPETKGYPTLVQFPDFWNWLKAVIDDSAEWCSEEDLPDIEPVQLPPDP